MIQIKFKNYLINFFSIIMALILCLSIANFIFIKISQQKIFPRSLASSLPNLLLTFYPDTYNKKGLNDYIAILGGSYSQGGGDAYLNGTYDFSIAHHLHKNVKKNYLIFGRAGYGSTSAVANLITMHKLSNSPNLIEDLNKPSSIIFFFYEGNVLEANLREYRSFAENSDNLNYYVANRIEQKIKLKKIDKWNNNFPLMFFLTKIYRHFENLFNKMVEAKDFKKIKNLIAERIKKLFGYAIILGSDDDLNKNRLKHINSILTHNDINNIRPLQGAAPGLSNEEMSMSLEIFFESVKYVKLWSQTDKITIIHIPSPISSYTWNEPINYEIIGSEEVGTTSNKKNFSNSIFIRNKIKDFSLENGIEFLDLTEHIFENGKQSVLHGPMDWRHLNYDGYEKAASFIISRLKK